MMYAPRTCKAPICSSPQGQCLWRSFEIRICTPNKPCPCLDFFSIELAAERGKAAPEVPHGPVSVIPQTWQTSTLWSSSSDFSSAEGGAEPATTTRFNLEKVWPTEARCATKPCQMVGTPLANVTPNELMVSASGALSSCKPGSTSAQPVMADANGKPHEPCAW